MRTGEAEAPVQNEIEADRQRNGDCHRDLRQYPESQRHGQHTQVHRSAERAHGQEVRQLAPERPFEDVESAEVLEIEQLLRQGQLALAVFPLFSK